MKRMLLVLGRGLVVYVATSLLSLAIYYFVPKQTLLVNDQPVGAAIHIARVSLIKNGFVVLQKSDDEGYGTPYIDIGEANVLLPGTYTDINIELRLPSQVAPLKPGDGVYVTLYQDNGDDEFHAETDMPVRKINGRKLTKRITLL